MSSAFAMPAAAAQAACAHCGSPILSGVDGAFCCHGCASVYELLQSAGLERYYVLRAERRLSPVARTAGSFAGTHESPWCEALRQELALQSGLRQFRLDVQGIQCGACVWLIEALFRRAPGAAQVRLNPALGQLSCVVDESFELEAFVRSVESFGYRLGPEQKHSSGESDALLLRTGICVALALNGMLLSAATYFGLEQGPLLSLVQTASIVLATLSALVGGSYFVARAWRGLSLGILHLDLPIALGMGLAYFGSLSSLVFGDGQSSYLDTVSVFIALMLVGRLLQERLVERNRKALLSADGASALLARRVRAGRTELVSCAELRVDDELLVCPGELVPVRGRLEGAAADCALDWISGESAPRRFEPGDTLVAGAVNVGASALRVRALCDFARSDLDALLAEDDSAKLRTAGDFWDKLARIYVVLVLMATALGALTWTLLGEGLTRVLDVSTAILVVTCPCAFGIATPLAYELAVAGLRKAGLFVRDGSFFDRAARVRRVVFDKTGTLTTGVLELVDASLLARLSFVQRSALYDLTAQSGHPKSAAVARALARCEPPVALGGQDTSELPGRGVTCVRDGITYRFGSASFALVREASDAGDAAVFSADGQLLVALACREVLRPDAALETRALSRDGYELFIASGDMRARAQALALDLGVPETHVFGDLTPADKLALIERVGASETLMVGDGINDAPALSRAVCAGTPAVDRPFVPARADFYFLTPGLHPVRLALQVAGRVRGVVRNALWFATAYNVFAVALSVAGLMQPWLAALLMPASSLLVIAYTVWSLNARSSLWTS
jgi:Cu2+-exporting ATPase